jgi:hypothetical protein
MENVSQQEIHIKKMLRKYSQNEKICYNHFIFNRGVFM